MATPTIFHHPLEERLRIIQALNPHLPASIPLYRRLQFQHFTSDSHILCSLDPTSYKDGQYAGLDEPWIAAYVDRSRRPETEVWIFGTWESQTDQYDHDKTRDSQAESLLRALVTEIRQTCALGEQSSSPAIAAQLGCSGGPPLPSSKSSKSSATSVGRGEYEGHLANPSIVLFGAVHERTVALMKTIGVLSSEFVGADIPYRKYMFDISTDRIKHDNLPSDLVWGKVRPEHFSLVKSRTQIPRQDKTLRQLPSLAMFTKQGGDPVAWSFLGPDASLSSLHVEPEWRGRGLAKTLAARIFATEMEVYWGGGHRDQWAHADVAVDNVPSNGVCKGLGGIYNFHVLWVRIDVSQV